MKLKCPVCAKLLPLDPQLNSPTIICSSCDSSFNVERIAEIYRKQRQKKSEPNPSVKQQPEQSVRQMELKATRPEFQRSDVQISVSGEPEPSLAAGVDLNSARLIASRHRRTPGRTALLVSLVALAAVMSLLVWAVYQMNVVNRSGAEETGSLDSAEQLDASADAHDDSNPSEAVNRKPIATNDLDGRREFRIEEEALHEDEDQITTGPFARLDRPALKPDSPETKFKTAKTMRDSWFAIQPYLVELRAQTPTGDRFATGTIVDSRGWVLTSYPAMAGATRIDFRAAAKDVLPSTSRDSVIDQVRGIVAFDVERGLILLSINRRFVSAFDDVKFDVSSRVVPSQYLIQAAPPIANWPWPTAETRIAALGTASQLDQQAASPLTRIGFDDEESTLLLHQQKSPLRVGAPLVNDQGEIVAINIVAIAEDALDVIAIGADQLVQFKREAGLSTMPLPVPVATAIEDGRKTGDQESEAAMTVVDAESSARQFSEQINRAGVDCRRFQFWPTNTDQAEDLRQLLKLLLEADRRLETEVLPDDCAVIIEQIDQWRGELERSAGTAGSRSSRDQQQFNRLVNVADERGLIAGFALTHHTVSESPAIELDGSGTSETVVLELLGSRQRIIVNVKQGWPPMPPDSPWLIVAEPLPGEVQVSAPDGKSESMKPARIMIIIQADTPD